MGPFSSLSSMIETVNEQTSAALQATDRLRSANRHLTGSDGRAPVPLGAGGAGAETSGKVAEMPPLMVQLTTGLNRLSEAQSELRKEIDYLEQHSETGAPSELKAAGSTYGASRA